MGRLYNLLTVDQRKILFAAVSSENLVLEVVSGHDFTLVLRHVDFWKLEGRFALVSVEALGNFLTTQMRLVTLFDNRLAILVDELVVVARELLLRRFFVEHLTSGLTLLLNVRVNVNEFKGFFL